MRLLRLARRLQEALRLYSHFTIFMIKPGVDVPRPPGPLPTF